MSQVSRISAHLKSGKSITPVYALNQFQCFRLAARISDLRDKGMLINKKMVKNHRTGARYASYSLA
jgi:hypothetical protein